MISRNSNAKLKEESITNSIKILNALQVVFVNVSIRTEYELLNSYDSHRNIILLCVGMTYSYSLMVIYILNALSYYFIICSNDIFLFTYGHIYT